MKNSFSAWLHGTYDLTEQIAEPTAPRKGQPRAARDVEKVKETLVRDSHAIFTALAVVLCLVLSAFLLLAVSDLPAFGDETAPTVGEVPLRYVEKGTEETGALNTVAGMILDYRAFDTLGESFVLFTATVVVTILMSNAGARHSFRLAPEVVDYSHDPIISTVSKLIIPIVLVFGVYVLLNGHLSPGGGFSGGAILAAAPILYAMVWGDRAAHAVFRPRLLRAVTVASLSFYVVSKTYSFFTGANHLPSIISTGTPGNIFSAGLILPLNISVGFVVCCTMYSFYAYFRRGEL